MIFDLEKMRECNAKYIFYNDGTSRKITPDMVPEILRYLAGELQYYSRLYDDFKNRYDDTMKKFDSLPVPDSKYFEDNAIMKYPFMDIVQAETLKEKRHNLWSECGVYASIVSDSLNKCYHFKKCLRLLTGSEW